MTALLCSCYALQEHSGMTTLFVTGNLKNHCHSERVLFTSEVLLSESRFQRNPKSGTISFFNLKSEIVSAKNASR